MRDYKERNENEIFTKVLKAGRRTYFFDVRETKAGDYYLTITESKKHFSDNGEANFEKHKIYLYKEDFRAFLEQRNLKNMIKISNLVLPLTAIARFNIK